MTKTWNSLGVVSILGIALLIGTAAAATTSEVKGNVEGAVAIISGPLGAAELGFNPAQSPKEQEDSIQIKSNMPWEVQVSDAGADTTGYMAEYNTSTPGYVGGGNKLASPMTIDYISGGTDGADRVLPTGGQLAYGDVATGDTAETVAFNYSQPVSWGDTILTGDNVYRIEVTFTAGSLP